MTTTTETISVQLLEAGAHHGNALYRLVKLCASFDDTTEWALEGSPTPAHWIAVALDVELCTAREWIRVGKKLAELSVIDQAFGEQRLSYAKVRALTRVAVRGNEAELVDLAVGVPAGRLHRVLAAWSLKHQDPAVIDQRHQRDRGLFTSTDADGALIATLVLPPLAGAQLLAAVDAGAGTTRLRTRRWPSDELMGWWHW